MYDLSKLRAHGEDVFIDETARIVRPQLVEVGSHVGIDFCVFTSVGMKIGNYVHISPHVSVVGGADGLLEMGDFTTIACGSRLICNGETFSGNGLVGPIVPAPYRDTMRSGPIRFERFASIASNVVVFAGVTLAEGTVVGSGSVVTKNTEPWTFYAGAPARPVKARRRDAMPALAKQMGY
ncbi:MAG TPA: acyltransferase [Reyranella sp.]|jgi:galactoside O-acetyltransferase|nr:acyltransferase [Reyranella sp.]